jgi:hypothetical protein
MKALLTTLIVIMLSLSVLAQEKPPALDLAKMPPITSGKSIAWSEFHAKLKEIFLGGSCQTITRQIPTPGDVEKMISFVEGFLCEMYPGDKILGLLGLLANTSWKEASLVLYLDDDGFRIAVLTTTGWMVIFKDQQTCKLKIAPLSLNRKPIYLGF